MNLLLDDVIINNIPLDKSMDECNVILSKFNELAIKQTFINTNDNNTYKPYVYLITDIPYDKHYIGVRYTSNRYNTNSLEDLKRYMSSSTDISFKKRQIEYPECFKYIVLREFNNKIQAQNYESLLHQMYEVSHNANFYNKHTECFIEYKIFTTKFWDVEESKEIQYEDVAECVRYDSVMNLINRKVLIISDRFCLFDRKEEATAVYSKRNTIYQIYKWDHNNNCIIEIEVLYKDGIKLMGGDFYSLIDPHNNIKRCKQYYIDSIRCEFENKLHTVYKWNYTHKDVDVFMINYEEGNKLIGLTFYKLFTDKKTVVKGWYNDYNMCKLDHSYYCFYKWDPIINDVTEHTVMYKDGNKAIGTAFYRLINSNSSCKKWKEWYSDRNLCLLHNSVYKLFKWDKLRKCTTQVTVSYKNGVKMMGESFWRVVRGECDHNSILNGIWYFSDENCVKMNTEYEIFKWDCNSESVIKLIIKGSDGCRVIGSNFWNLVDPNRNRKHIGDWYLDPYECEIQNKTYKFVNTINNKIITCKLDEARKIMGSRCIHLVRNPAANLSAGNYKLLKEKNDRN